MLTFFKRLFSKPSKSEEPVPVKEEKKIPSLSDIDLSQPVQLRFVKVHATSNRYFIEFFHPLYQEYWTLPDTWRASVSKRWSLLEKGGYGVYDLNKKECAAYNIDFWKKEFKTMLDIYNYLEGFAKEYDDFQAREKANNERPDVIY